MSRRVDNLLNKMGTITQPTPEEKWRLEKTKRDIVSGRRREFNKMWAVRQNNLLVGDEPSLDKWLEVGRRLVRPCDFRGEPQFDNDNPEAPPTLTITVRPDVRSYEYDVFDRTDKGSYIGRLGTTPSNGYDILPRVSVRPSSFKNGIVVFMNEPPSVDWISMKIKHVSRKQKPHGENIIVFARPLFPTMTIEEYVEKEKNRVLKAFNNLVKEVW